MAAMAKAADAPVISAERMMPATNPAEGAAALETLLRNAASASTVQLSLRPLPARLDGLAMTRIEARGTEDRLRAFAETAEGPASPLRFTTWSIASDGAGGLVLKADAAAPWTHAATEEATPLPEADPAPRAPARTLVAVN
jgi:hypothetical protein